MVNTFMAQPDLSGFTALPARVDLMTRNPPQGYGAAASARMDFSDYDRTDRRSRNREGNCRLPDMQRMLRVTGIGTSKQPAVGTDLAAEDHVTRRQLPSGRGGLPAVDQHRVGAVLARDGHFAADTGRLRR